MLLAVVGAQERVSGPATIPPHLTIEHSQSHIELRGDVSSLAHGAMLRQTVLQRFPDKQPVFRLTVRPALPPGWALVTEMTLRGLAETHSASASISVSEIFVRGITTSRARWSGAASRIEQSLLPGMSFRHQVDEIRMPASLRRQCIELFRTAIRGRRIEFAPASAELGTGSAPLLDEVIQIAADCPLANITITGHTDNTGGEAGNLALSQARARSVADYIIAGGIGEDRIRAVGAGSSQPLVDENTSRAHRMNRRIELEIDFP